MIDFIYSIQLPKDEKYNLESHMRRAMLSTLLNVREGNAFTDGNRNNQFNRAMGSLMEVEECFLFAERMKYTKNHDKETFYIHYWKCFNKLLKLIKSIKS